MEYITAGESHGPVLTAIVSGVPAGLAISEKAINSDLARRQSGYGRGGRQAIEKDKVSVTSGVRFGHTIGSPVTLSVANRDWSNWTERMSVFGEPPQDLVREVTPRPGHADLLGVLKNDMDDCRNILERSSARETTMRVAAAGIAREFLAELGVEIYSYVVSIGDEIMEEEEAYMDEAENDETAAAEPDGQSDAQLIESSLDENATKLIEQANSRAEQIIAEANAQAQQIIADAQAQSQADAGRALEQAQQQGYTQGYSEGNQKAVQETQAKMAELSEKEAAMEREYQEKLDNVEPYLVDKLTDIYDHIFAVDLSEYRNVIFHLISNTLHALENTDTYLIHVSEQDYQFVSMQKTQIAEDGGVKPSMLEFVEDRTLGKNECLIETPDGIYDCSLSVQLSELKRKLLLLSYSGAKEQ